MATPGVFQFYGKNHPSPSWGICRVRFTCRYVCCIRRGRRWVQDHLLHKSEMRLPQSLQCLTSHVYLLYFLLTTMRHRAPRNLGNMAVFI